MNTAALYLRSSKDRSDVSIDAQRRELRNLAKDRKLLVVKEFSDVVESAKDEHRPGFQALLQSLKDPARGWNHLLLVDTSRLSRRRYMAQVFKHEAAKRGVKIIYSKLPATDPISDMVIIGVMEVFDELHSLMSREKGLAGMAENVRQGYRAGGRAPKGYRLVRIETGAIREGASVSKSRLEPDESAPVVARFLKLRAKGISRIRAAKEAGVNFPKTTLIGLEWNALTYAGCTVWNVHNEYSQGGYKGGMKRRPRDEWVVQPETHAALITEAEAEAILARISVAKITRRTPAKYMLSGLLRTHDGKAWHGDGIYYKTGTRRMRKEFIEKAVLERIAEDMRSEAFVTELTRETRRLYGKRIKDPTIALRKDLLALNSRISKAMDIASQLADPGPALRKLDELERGRTAIISEIARLEKEYAAQSALSNITEASVRGILGGLIDQMGQASENEQIKDLLLSMIEKIELDPQTGDCRISYRISCGDKVASPREYDLIPTLRAYTLMTLSA